jgi:hypothetical protein
MIVPGGADLMTCSDGFWDSVFQSILPNLCPVIHVLGVRGNAWQFFICLWERLIVIFLRHCGIQLFLSVCVERKKHSAYSLFLKNTRLVFNVHLCRTIKHLTLTLVCLCGLSVCGECMRIFVCLWGTPHCYFCLSFWITWCFSIIFVCLCWTQEGIYLFVYLCGTHDSCLSYVHLCGTSQSDFGLSLWFVCLWGTHDNFFLSVGNVSVLFLLVIVKYMMLDSYFCLSVWKVWLLLVICPSHWNTSLWFWFVFVESWIMFFVCQCGMLHSRLMYLSVCGML